MFSHDGLNLINLTNKGHIAMERYNSNYVIAKQNIYVRKAVGFSDPVANIL